MQIQRRQWFTRAGMLVLVVTLAAVGSARAEDPDPESLVARALAKESHPLQAALRWAVEGRKRVQSDIRDYTCILVKRERVDGRLLTRQFMFAKVRHRRQEAETVVPFGVYLKFYAPGNVKNREVLFVEGQNEGKLIAKNGGDRFSFITTTLKPDSALALRDNRYPITQIGFKNLIEELVKVARDEIIRDGSEVRYYKNARVDDRECIKIEVQAREDNYESDFYLARVYIDRELMIPIHYEAFDWPETDDGDPILLEQYTYRDIRINVGLKDVDFQRENPKYGFR